MPPSRNIRERRGVQTGVKICLALLLAPLALVAAGAAGPGIAGSWDCVAIHANGGETQWTLAIKEDAGKLTATLRSTDGYILETIEPKLEDNQFTFKVRVNEKDTIEVLLKVEGDRMDGRFGGNTVGAGLFKAVRAGAPKIAGVWTGEWEIDPDGRRGSGHYMVLRQEGAGVTGTVGPTEAQQAPIADGKFVGDKLSFDVTIPYGPKIGFAFTVSGDTMRGTAVLTVTGAQRTFNLSVKRAQR